MRFKKGDKVKRIRKDFYNETYPEMKYGVILTVIQCTPTGGIFFKEIRGRWDERYFEKVGTEIEQISKHYNI